MIHPWRTQTVELKCKQLVLQKFAMIGMRGVVVLDSHHAHDGLIGVAFCWMVSEVGPVCNVDLRITLHNLVDTVLWLMVPSHMKILGNDLAMRSEGGGSVLGQAHGQRPMNHSIAAQTARLNQGEGYRLCARMASQGTNTKPCV